MARTLQDVKKMIEDNGICMVDFKLTDIDGRWRHLSIPAERLTETTMELGIGFDASNYGYAPIESSDMVFIPVLDSAVIDRYAKVPTLSMIGDVCIIDLPKNRPFDQYPRNVAIRALEYMKETGVADQMIIGPEYEFYLFDEVKYNTDYFDMFTSIHTSQAAFASGAEDNNNGYQLLPGAGYHNSLPTDIRNDLRSRMCMAMAEWGIDVKYHHPEVGGSGQMEIEVELGDMLKLADDTMSAKYVIKNEAVQDGITATFMPKPLAQEAGSGMHVHMHLFKDGQPVFYDKDGYAQLSKEAHYFMGGLLSHARSLCAITNPSTNSYKRLVPGFEAPVTIGYAMSNRSAVIRIPAYAKTPETKRFELRNPDATCNPYLAYAAILMAGLDGIKNKIDPHEKGWGPYDFNLYTLSEEEKKKIAGLPSTLNEALDALEADHDYLLAGGVFPERLLTQLVGRCRKAASAINKLPHPMEFAMYYDL
ncbi:MAG: type I glutamate--ammonia ligase [Lachnospiraceae bacterium]|nr:type I glutamate--ammonia ligase [Lachnospiraceae bacterium]